MPKLIAPMAPRDPKDAHRAATPLELFFDLVFVIAIAAAAAGLHHGVAENHALEGIIYFSVAFFAIWWAWMNFTWFASAYDNDDTVYRLLVMVIMAGALVMAAGIPKMFDGLNVAGGVTGYVIMRVGMVALWLRAAAGDPARRRTALTYALGIALVQVFWIGFAFAMPLPMHLALALFCVGVVLELAVPVIAERAAVTPWHRHHIIERYGLLNIIVLGETLLAGVMALQQSGGDHFSPMLIATAVAALVVVFVMWWVYFTEEDHLVSHALPDALLWGYGHLVIFAAGAAVGAGFAVLVDTLTHHAHIELGTAYFAVGIPVAVYFAGLWFVRDRKCLTGPAAHVLLAGALVILAALALGAGMFSLAGIAVVTAGLRTWLARAAIVREAVG